VWVPCRATAADYEKSEFRVTTETQYQSNLLLSKNKQRPRTATLCPSLYLRASVVSRDQNSRSGYREAEQSSWLLIQRSRVRFPALPDFLSSSGSGTGSTQPL
jgi:hypothetical protein